MGCCASSPEWRRTRQIDRELEQDRKKKASEVKLLLLGAGESGKSTILKQMRLIYAGGFSIAEREAYRAVVFANVFESVRALLEAMERFLIPLEKARNLTFLPLFINLPAVGRYQQFPEIYYHAFASLWADSGVQLCFSRSNQFVLPDSAKYFLDSLPRLFALNYLPTDQDILRARLKTTGITETAFEVGHVRYNVVDVGGQRSERKKWIHCFEDVTAMIFLAALSAYDQTNTEQRTSVNQMREALLLFDSICNSPWFVKTSIILFLNKIDIFQEKISRSPISRYFPEYNGPSDDFTQTSTFFKRKFESLYQHGEAKQMYTHFTFATETDHFRRIMRSVSDIILSRSLRELAF